MIPFPPISVFFKSSLYPTTTRLRKTQINGDDDEHLDEGETGGAGGGGWIALHG